jgi:hypothetical protein
LGKRPWISAPGSDFEGHRVHLDLNRTHFGPDRSYFG